MLIFDLYNFTPSTLIKYVFTTIKLWMFKIRRLLTNLYINLVCLFVCLSVCLFVCLFASNKRQNGWTDQAQIFCVISRDPREGLWMIKFSKICLHQNSIFENFENPRIFFWKSAKFFFVICLQGEALCILFLQMKLNIGAKRP